jgi:rSAM/selenodomain-associated transferase 1
VSTLKYSTAFPIENGKYLSWEACNFRLSVLSPFLLDTIAGGMFPDKALRILQLPLTSLERHEIFEKAGHLIVRRSLRVVLKAESKTSLIVFAKAPVPGTVKTRMQSILGETNCLLLHNALARHALERIRLLDLPNLDKAVFFTGAPEEVLTYAKKLGIAADISVEIQFGENLGERLSNALEKKILCGYKKVVFIGTDSPLLGNDIIEEAIEGLGSHDVVIGPAMDGGYYLIGFSDLIPSILEGINWGSSLVFDQTLELMKKNSLHWKCLKKGFDLDTCEDLVDFYESVRATQAIQTESSLRELMELIKQILEIKS